MKFPDLFGRAINKSIEESIKGAVDSLSVDLKRAEAECKYQQTKREMEEMHRRAMKTPSPPLPGHVYGWPQEFIEDIARLRDKYKLSPGEIYAAVEKMGQIKARMEGK